MTGAMIEQLSAAAEHRGSVAARKADGAFFTANDVATWLARRAIDAIMEQQPAGVELRRQRLASLRVLDPTCGAGAFLVAAWHELRRWQDALDAEAGDADGPRVTGHQLHGFDIDAGAARAARAILESLGASGASIEQVDALDALTRAESFDLVLGNPPYVRAAVASAPPDARSAVAGNVAAWIVEAALAVCAPGARIAMVLPVSAASSAQWSGLRHAWDERCGEVWATHFDTIPCTLFPDVVQRVTLLEGNVAATTARWHTSRYHRWLRSEREGLLDRVQHVALGPIADVRLPLPKLGSELELDLWARLHEHEPLGRWFEPQERGNVVYYKRRWSYFLLFADFIPPIWDEHGNERLPSELQTLGITPDIDARAVAAICSSTLFWWWFSVRTDNRNVNRGDIATFPAPSLHATDIEALAQLGAALMDALRASAEVRTCTYRSIGTIRNTYYRQAETRPVLDRIDAVLARCYGMSDQQLDAVLAYERRFRS